MATALVTQIAYAVQTLFDPAGTAGRLVDLGKLANYGLLGGAATTVWLPSELFTTGVNGTWYDPSDMTTLFQDAAGTTPVTAVEQPVGKMLDKSGRGNHAFNNSGNSANFPVLSARYNLLTKSEDFSASDWTFQNNSGSATRSGNNITFGASKFDAIFQFNKAFTAGVNYSAKVKLSGAGSVRLLMSDGNGAIIGTTNVTLTGTPTVYTVSATSVTSGLGGGVGIYGSGSAASFTAYTSDLRVANDALNQPAYQRVNTTSDYDSVGFKPYLKFNGVNQWLKTNSIDFTYTDKMFVCAGLRKLSDTFFGVIAELGTDTFSSAGTFAIGQRNNGAELGYGSLLNGSQPGGYWPSTYVAPHTAVLSTAFDIGGSLLSDEVKPRVNAAIPSSLPSWAGNNAGTGNFSNRAMYIGARGGSLSWFNGRIYQLVVAGKQASASEITNTETYLNQKTGAY